MKNYQDLLAKILEEGTWQNNRTGIRSKRIEGAMLEFDLTKGFPAVTTKKLAFKQVVGELLGFIRGYDNAEDFRMLGCTVWDQNANENQAWLDNPRRKGQDDLGSIYGVQWRGWNGVTLKDECLFGTSTGKMDISISYVDQLRKALETILIDPTSRRNIVTAWNPAELGDMALPPCHIMHQYLCDPETKEISMCMYQRSCDMFLGIPFNIASYALLLHLVAECTGHKAKKLVMMLADAHIYENHVDQVNLQLTREPKKLPTLVIPEYYDTITPIMYLEMVEPDGVWLEEYDPWPAIKAPMAV